MTCSSCTHAVETVLSELPGVTSAVVSLVQQEARIEFDPGLVRKVGGSVVLAGQDDRPGCRHGHASTK